MLRKVSVIVLICVEIVFLHFDEVICKPGGGHYSSQRTLGSGSSGSHGGSIGNQQNAWGNPWSPEDVNSCVLTSLKMPNKGTSAHSTSSKSFQQMPPMFNYHQYPYYYLALNDSDSIPDEQRLMAYLLRNYDPSARPVYNASNTVSVAFGISLTQLSDMDEKNQILTTNIWLEQEWFDQRLIWNASDFNGLSTLRLPCSKIWLPDIVLYNSADDYTQGFYQSKAMVESTGHVFWPPPAKFRSSCKIDVTYFPFDGNILVCQRRKLIFLFFAYDEQIDQLCKLKFGSWSYDAAQVNLTKRRDTVDMANYIRSGEWHIVNIDIKRNDVTYPCCPGIYYPDVTIYVHIRRRVLYYLFNIIFPCIWLSILSLLGFWLPSDSGEKITLGITVLLAFSVFMLLIAESMPATSEMVPLIEVYLTVVMALTSLSIVLTVYVLQLHHSGPVVVPIPYSFKYTLVRFVAPLVGMRKIVRIYAEEHQLIGKDEVYRCFSKVDAKPSHTPLIVNHQKYPMEKPNNKLRQDARYREETLDDDNEEEDEEGKLKQFLPNVSLANGDVRTAKRAHVRHHHHRSRSRVPQIVLIPEQSHQIPFMRNSNTSSHYELFNSNMFLLEKHLKRLIDRQKQEEERNEIVNEWKLMALIMDRLLFWIFTTLTILSTIFSLIIIPWLKNTGYIAALNKEIFDEYKSNESLTNLIDESMKMNLSGS
ncbi:unnamed protein product [Adineta ricciae]|uniref:Uncharacterized protein n=1 Tax=Adineta ricciae TaxID=249248 RepID=A0A815XI71_ADIRI|nr:unnamed protein product [Adineta ricciae]